MSTTPRVLIVDDDVSDLLLFRRLLRETPYTVDTVRSASQALAALGKQEYAAVIADDERLPDLSGSSLLTEIERMRPAALRLLLCRSERIPQLVDGAEAGRYRLVARPFFAKPLVTALVEHAAQVLTPQLTSDGEVTQKTKIPVIEEREPAPAEPARPPAAGRIAQRRILLTLAELVEAKAGHSSGHGARVSALAGVLAKEAGVPDEIVEVAEDAGLVHDVGELAIDAQILRHPGELSLEEHKEVQAHVLSSHNIVRRAGLAQAVLDAVRHHHERLDGRGYPDALAGEAIPLAARVIAVADTWDALATDRPYRAAAPLGECSQRLGRMAGTQLDPNLVALFLERRLYDLIDWTDPPRPGIKLV